jgi:hypothetical protein
MISSTVVRTAAEGHSMSLFLVYSWTVPLIALVLANNTEGNAIPATACALCCYVKRRKIRPKKNNFLRLK